MFDFTCKRQTFQSEHEEKQSAPGIIPMSPQRTISQTSILAPEFLSDTPKKVRRQDSGFIPPLKKMPSLKSTIKSSSHLYSDGQKTFQTLETVKKRQIPSQSQPTTIISDLIDSTKW